LRDLTATGFRPHLLTRGSHRQTLLGYLHRRKLRFDAPSEDLIVDVEAEVRLLLRVSWQPGLRESSPALILIHGLGGSDASGYLLAMGLLAWRQGWHVVRMNMRGAGASERLCLGLYNAGLDGDLLAVLRAVEPQAPRLAVAGFSLGANLALLAAGRSAARLPAGVRGIAAVSPPLDLGACAAALEHPGNRLYQSYFMRALRAAYARRAGLRPDLFAAGRERGLRTVREYDEAITAPYGGYRDALDYYTRSSAGPQLAKVACPTLLLAAADDPMIPRETLECWPISGSVRREITATGGHVGFVAPTLAPGRFWAGERALAFLTPLVS
jgi:predicted alpha/beta-fold hydrolase